MKKKIFTSIIFSIVLLIGAIFFINNSFKTNIYETKKYIVIKVKNGKYNFPLTFKKNVLVKNVLLTFGIDSFLQIKKIEVNKSKKKKEVFLDDKLINDTTIKVIY